MVMELYHLNIGNAIRERREELGYTKNKCSEPLAKKWEIRSAQITAIIRNIEDGYIYGNYSMAGVSENINLHLGRLSDYLFYLQFDTADPLVEEIRRIDDRFLYPPNKLILF